MKLIVIAGCNGAGKSTYGRTIIKSFVDNQDFIYVDLDNVAKQLEKKFPIIEELNEKVQEYFICSIKEAILKRKIFIYESNLRVNISSFIYPITSSTPFHISRVPSTRNPHRFFEA